MEYVNAKHIVTNVKKGGSSWFGMDFNMNIYRGCCHGCIYCDSRSSCYGIEDFDTVKAKKDALQIIRDDLRRKASTGVIGTGAMSDPYNPFEEELNLTRHALELVDAFGFGIGIATKSDLVTRDVEILKEIQEHSPVLCKITVTAAEDSMSALVEPRAPVSSRRFQAVKTLREAGIFAGILLMPVLPYLEDSQENVLAIVEKAHAAGAAFIYPAFGMTLRENQRAWYYKKLGEIFPQKGLEEIYIRQFGNSYECRSPQARKLWRVFAAKCQEYGILYEMKDIICAYKRGYEYKQVSLFDFFSPL